MRQATNINRVETYRGAAKGFKMAEILRIEGPVSREDEWDSTIFEFHVTYESGRVMRWLLEFSHSKRTFSTRPAGCSGLAPVFPKMLLALGYRPIDIHGQSGGLRSHLRSMLSPENIAICAQASLRR